MAPTAVVVSLLALIWFTHSSFPIFMISFPVLQCLQLSNSVSSFSAHNCYYYSYRVSVNFTACTILHETLFTLTCHTAISSWIFQELVFPQKRWSQEKATSLCKEPSTDSAGLKRRRIDLDWTRNLYNYNTQLDLSWKATCPWWIINFTCK